MIREIEELVGKIPEFDSNAAEQAQARWNSIAKPLNSLGLLETVVTRIAGLTGDPAYRIDKRLLIVCSADNGVVRQGVSQADSSITAILADALTKGELSVCKMSGAAGVDVLGVDMGMHKDLRLPGLLDRRIAFGTNDLSEGPAMSREQALQAIRYGYELAAKSCKDGYRIIATGELGIGNTTTSSAIAAVLLGKTPAEVTGCGAGLSSEGVRKKIAVIEKAIALNRPDPNDPLDVLAKLGGFDIAGMVGIYLAGAAHRTPVLVDGLISSVAALVARRLCPEAGIAMFASHVSSEPAAKWVLEDLGLEPLLTAGMHLGEGTGAVAVIPVLDMAYAVYHGMATFDGLAIDSYKPLS